MSEQTDKQPSSVNIPTDRTPSSAAPEHQSGGKEQAALPPLSSAKTVATTATSTRAANEKDAYDGKMKGILPLTGVQTDSELTKEVPSTEQKESTVELDPTSVDTRRSVAETAAELRAISEKAVAGILSYMSLPSQPDQTKEVPSTKQKEPAVEHNSTATPSKQNLLSCEM